MEIQKEQRGAQLRLLVLLPIIVTFSLALSLIVYSTNTFFNYQFTEENKATTLRVQRSFEEQITHDISDITGLLQLIENKPEIISAWQQQDRQQLSNAAAEIYKTINAVFDITHFYFHSLDGKNFLRVHRPGRFGDNIQRKTLLAARRTGKLRAGLEVVTFGQFVLRIVQPWTINGKLVGYLELGKEITHITRGLKAITNAEIVTLIDKQLINKKDWQQVFGSQFDWQQFDKWVVASSTLTTIPDNLDLFPQQNSRVRKSSNKHKNDQTYTASHFVLKDFSKSDVGRMVVIQDITASYEQLRNLLTNIAIIGSMIILLISIGYFIYLGRIEDRLAMANRTLYQKIGEHKLAENKLRINRDELASINRELESYSYSIAHDLRAPLRSVTSFSQIVLEDAKDKLNEDETDNLNRVVAASIRMAELIDDILQLSRITREELSRKEINLSKLVERSQHQLASQDPNRKVEWDIQADIVVNADPRLMERAIENLINNAWKYTGHTDNAKITFGTISKNNETIYFVRDNGAGFDMNYAHKLFATFQRLHNPREFTGSGVGLAIVLRVIQRHRGRIWGEGEVGKGAAFYFTLPDTSTG
jgi:signal transduction histidine kinase